MILTRGSAVLRASRGNASTASVIKGVLRGLCWWIAPCLFTKTIGRALAQASDCFFHPSTYHQFSQERLFLAFCSCEELCLWECRSTVFCSQILGDMPILYALFREMPPFCRRYCQYVTQTTHFCSAAQLFLGASLLLLARGSEGRWPSCRFAEGFLGASARQGQREGKT
jgi:hypothetical protein